MSGPRLRWITICCHESMRRTRCTEMAVFQVQRRVKQASKVRKCTRECVPQLTCRTIFFTSQPITSLLYDVIVVVVSTSDVNESNTRATFQGPLTFFFFFIIWRRFFFFQSRSSNDILASYDYAFTVSEKRDLFFFLEYSDVTTSYVNS